MLGSSKSVSIFVAFIEFIEKFGKKGWKSRKVYRRHSFHVIPTVGAAKMLTESDDAAS